MERAGIIEDIGSELSKFLSTETIFGEPMVINNVTLIPVQSVSLGFGGGVGTGKASKGEGHGTGSGAGAMLRPEMCIRDRFVIEQMTVVVFFSWGNRARFRMATIVESAIIFFPGDPGIPCSFDPFR